MTLVCADGHLNNYMHDTSICTYVQTRRHRHRLIDVRIYMHIHASNLCEQHALHYGKLASGVLCIYMLYNPYGCLFIIPHYYISHNNVNMLNALEKPLDI